MNVSFLILLINQSNQVVNKNPENCIHFFYAENCPHYNVQMFACNLTQTTFRLHLDIKWLIAHNYGVLEPI